MQEKTHTQSLLAELKPTKSQHRPVAMDYSEDDLKKFWSRVQKGNENDCWIWIGAKSPRGYGLLPWPKKQCRATRVAYFIFFQKDPDELGVLHRCDNPSCVNPAHLFLGTPKDNAHDRDKKGRQIPGISYGESHGNHKLTTAEVCEIRQKHADGLFNQSQLSKQYSITAGHISDIILRKKRNNG